MESAMKKKNYEHVIRLTQEGEEQDKSLPGLVKQWKEYRYKAFQFSGKLDVQRGIAVDFILDLVHIYFAKGFEPIEYQFKKLRTRRTL